MLVSHQPTMVAAAVAARLNCAAHMGRVLKLRLQSVCGSGGPRREFCPLQPLDLFCLMQADSMTGAERRAALSLAGIFSLRMLGLFMIYPVFAPSARNPQDNESISRLLTALLRCIYNLD